MKTFQYWLKNALEAYAEHEDMNIGEWLLLSLSWTNKVALQNSQWNGAVSTIDDVYSRDLWDWLNDVEANW